MRRMCCVSPCHSPQKVGAALGSSAKQNNTRLGLASAMTDKYRDFGHLSSLEHEGRDFRVCSIHRASPVAVVAPHGGGIEPGTSEIAKSIAGTDFSLYLFEGLKPSGNQDLHITSSDFDEARCIDLLAECDRVLTVHGDDSDPPVVFVGGLDVPLRDGIVAALESAGFNAGLHPDPRLQGRDSKNICNRGRSKVGVQLEISAGFRKKLFRSLSKKGRTQPTLIFLKFVGAVRAALLPHATGSKRVLQVTASE